MLGRILNNNRSRLSVKMFNLAPSHWSKIGKVKCTFSSSKKDGDAEDADASNNQKPKQENTSDDKKPANPTNAVVNHTIAANSNPAQNSQIVQSPATSNPASAVIQSLQLYGLQINRHILPTQIEEVRLTPEQLKFYKKTSPNYLVALISKVINQNLQQDKEQNKFESESGPVDAMNKFYEVCVYCKVKYNKTFAILEGIHRCKIENISEVKMEGTLDSSSTAGEEQGITDGYTFDADVEELQQNQKSQQNQESQQNIDMENEESQNKEDQSAANSTAQQQAEHSHEFIQNRLNGKPNQSPVPEKSKFYKVCVKKMQESQIIMSSQLEIKFRHLLTKFEKFEKFEHLSEEILKTKIYSRIVFNIDKFHTILDMIATKCTQKHFEKEEIQNYLEIMQIQEKIKYVQKILSKRVLNDSINMKCLFEAVISLLEKNIIKHKIQAMNFAKRRIDGKNAKQLFLQKCTKKFQQQNPTKEAKQVFQKQIARYKITDDNSIQASVLKQYIQELSKIPYNIKSQEVFNLKSAQQTLDSEHYGMKDVKQAILELIAVGKLKGTLKGKIFCLIGGPGLGKTTFAKSVAKSLNRQFFNISLGGVSDSSVLKGHRRTYMGAYSGKIIEALKTCGTNNPVILLDEIDKMGSGLHGDPRSELLEILDPNQNQTFIDNYVDVKVDLSNVLFICSANYQQDISKPLMDRMERINLTSYTNDQKKEIFKRHLLRRAVEKCGVKEEDFVLEEGVVDSIVQDYCRGEPGVRYLEKNIIKILEKIALKIVTEEQTIPLKVNLQNLKDYIGNNYYRKKDHAKISKGVAISLGGGQHGGRLTYIQSFKKSHVASSKNKQHKRGVMFTGSLGDVFKQAMNISYSYTRNFLKETLSNNFLFENEVHIHAPDGAQKKDGAADSLTISSSLISLALKKQIKKGVGLTGELTLYGKVLKSFGIKEKVLVAKREKLQEIILPFENYAEVQMLSPEIKEGIKFHFVKEYKEVYDILFC